MRHIGTLPYPLSVHRKLLTICLRVVDNVAARLNGGTGLRRPRALLHSGHQRVGRGRGASELRYRSERQVVSAVIAVAIVVFGQLFLAVLGGAVVLDDALGGTVAGGVG